MRVSTRRAGGFKSCAAQTSRVESLTRPQSFGHLKVADRAIAFPRANPQLPSVGPLTPSIRLPTNQATFPRTRQRGALYGLPFYVRGGDLEIGDVLKVIARTERRWGPRKDARASRGDLACRAPERQLMQEDQTDRRASRKRPIWSQNDRCCRKVEN
jgi:hypothetical protein